MVHEHAPTAGGGSAKRLAVVLGITSVVLVAEVIGAVWTDSLALLADAGHMLTDTAGLVLALLAAQLMNRPASDTRTWGFRRAETLAAAAQATLLLAVGAYVLVEAIRRLVHPPRSPRWACWCSASSGWWAMWSRSRSWRAAERRI